MNIFGLMLYKQHIHQQKGVPHGLGTSMVVEVHSHLGGLQFGPGLQLHLLVEIVVSIQPVVILLLALIPDIVVPAMEAHVGMICSLLRAHMKPRAIDQDIGDISLPQSLQS